MSKPKDQKSRQTILLKGVCKEGMDACKQALGALALAEEIEEGDYDELIRQCGRVRKLIAQVYRTLEIIPGYHDGSVDL
jgi:hypothetical protein